jgi:hypothetical protein
MEVAWPLGPLKGSGVINLAFCAGARDTGCVSMTCNKAVADLYELSETKEKGLESAY